MKNVISLQAYKNVHIHGIPFTLVNLLSQNIRDQIIFSVNTKKYMISRLSYWLRGQSHGEAGIEFTKIFRQNTLQISPKTKMCL